MRWKLGGSEKTSKGSKGSKPAKRVTPAMIDHEKAETRKVKEGKTPETAPKRARRPRARDEGARPYVREEDGIAQGSPHNEKRKKHYDLSVPQGTKGGETTGLAPEKNRGAAKRSAEERTIDMFEREGEEGGDTSEGERKGGTIGEEEDGRGLGQKTIRREEDGGVLGHSDRKQRTLVEGGDGEGLGQTSPRESPESSVLGPETPEKQENGVSQENVTITLSNRPKRGILADLGVDREEHRKRLKVLPTYACSTCSLQTECPEFKEGYVCAYNSTFAAFPSRDADSVKEIMTEVLGENTKRWRMASLMEKIEGGGRADPNVTRLSEVVMAQAKNLVEFDEELQKVAVSVPTKALPGIQTREKGGLLRQLFAPAREAELPRSASWTPTMPTAPIAHHIVGSRATDPGAYGAQVSREEVPVERNVMREDVSIAAEVMPVEADSRELDSRGEPPPPGSNDG